MGRETAREIPEAVVGETLPYSVDFQGKLDSGELLTGTPTVEEVSTSDLTISNKVVSTSALVINGKTVAAGKAVQFTVSGFLVANSPYTIKITVNTDATPTPVKIGRVKFTVVS